MDLSERFGAAVEVAEDAGAIALEYYRNRGRLTIEQKGVQDHVSEADRETERVIRERLANLFPQDGFVGEESGTAGVAEGVGAWVVDPIDGTQPFLLGLPTWCVSIAYVHDGATQIGVIRNPVTAETYAALRGRGARLDGAQLHVVDAASLRDGLTGMGCSSRTTPEEIGHIAERLRAAGGMYHRTGSGALSLAYVAAGQLMGYLEPYMNSWDCLAGLLLVEEAGGRVCDFLADNGVAGGGRILASAPGVYGELESLFP